MKEIVPSSFLRDATALFHSPKSKTIPPARRSTLRSPSDLLAYNVASLATSVPIRWNHEPFPFLGEHRLVP